MDVFAAAVERLAEQIARETGTVIAPPRRISDNMPTPGDPLLLDVLDAACETAGASHRRRGDHKPLRQASPCRSNQATM